MPNIKEFPTHRMGPRLAMGFLTSPLAADRVKKSIPSPENFGMLWRLTGSELVNGDLYQDINFNNTSSNHPYHKFILPGTGDVEGACPASNALAE